MKFYTAEEVCDIIRISRRTLTEYFKSGRLKYFRIGNRKLVSHEDLQEFVNSQKARHQIASSLNQNLNQGEAV